jgi:hypothetical protein
LLLSFNNFNVTFELKTPVTDSVVGTVTRLHAGQAGVQIPAGARGVSLPQKVKTGSEAHTTL